MLLTDICPLWFHPTTQCTGIQQDSIAVIKITGSEAVASNCSRCRCINTTAPTSPSSVVVN